MNLTEKAYELRKSVLELCIKSGTGHLNSSMSCIDILTVLFYGGIIKHDPENPDWEERDRFILSKGQASPALYAILADRGYFPKEDLNLFAKKGGKFGVHLQNDVSGAELTSGSLGLGLGYSVGLAMGLRLKRALPLVFCLLGDGELYEGSVWESAMFASHHKLNNLVAIIDRNYLCATDFTENIVSLESLDNRFRSFGWAVDRVNGHSIPAIQSALERVHCRPFDKPLMLICETVKRYPIESFSNKPLLHGLAPKGEQIETALEELERTYEST
jgi:transketolase